MKQKRAYRYRFYPTAEQQQILARTFGCCRYVYNWALRQKTDAYYQRGERLSYYELLLKGAGEASVRRYRATHQSAQHREQVAYVLTHEALANLVGDIVA